MPVLRPLPHRPHTQPITSKGVASCPPLPNHLDQTMSLVAMNRIWDRSTQTGTPLVILLALADRADEDGICWPGVDWIAQRARLQPRQARNVLRALEESGEIRTINRKGGRYRTNLYIITAGMDEQAIADLFARRSDIEPLGPNCITKPGNPASQTRQSSVNKPGNFDAETRQFLNETRQSSVTNPAIAIADDPYRTVEPPIEPLSSARALPAQAQAQPETTTPDETPAPTVADIPAPVVSIPSRIISEDPPQGPKSRQGIHQAAGLDPRQLSAGLYAPGAGATAYQVYREVFDYTPGRTVIQEINQVVGTEPAALQRWRETLKAYALSGKPSSAVKIPLEWYRDGIPACWNPNTTTTQTKTPTHATNPNYRNPSRQPAQAGRTDNPNRPVSLQVSDPDEIARIQQLLANVGKPQPQPQTRAA